MLQKDIIFKKIRLTNQTMSNFNTPSKLKAVAEKEKTIVAELTTAPIKNGRKVVVITNRREIMLSRLQAREVNGTTTQLRNRLTRSTTPRCKPSIPKLIIQVFLHFTSRNYQVTPMGHRPSKYKYPSNIQK